MQMRSVAEFSITYNELVAIRGCHQVSLALKRRANQRNQRMLCLINEWNLHTHNELNYYPAQFIGPALKFV